MNNEKFVKLSQEKMLIEKSWAEFRETGLFWLINTMLQVFGWSLVYDYDHKAKEITRVYPARTKFRGFDTNTQEAAHRMIGKYMAENAQELKKESEL